LTNTQTDTATDNTGRLKLSSARADSPRGVKIINIQHIVDSKNFVYRLYLSVMQLTMLTVDALQWALTYLFDRQNRLQYCIGRHAMRNYQHSRDTGRTLGN